MFSSKKCKRKTQQQSKKEWERKKKKNTYLAFKTNTYKHFSIKYFLKDVENDNKSNLRTFWKVLDDFIPNSGRDSKVFPI